MSDHLLTGAELARVKALELTYDDVGATKTGRVPEGYDQLVRRATVGSGAAGFARAAGIVRAWGMQRGAGFRVQAETPTAVEDSVALLRLGIGPLSVTAPVRVVWVVDEPHRVGFGYGTLQGHPVSGEEAFSVELEATGDVVACVAAFSRPGSLATRLAGPFGRAGQRLMAARYLRAV